MTAEEESPAALGPGHALVHAVEERLGVKLRKAVRALIVEAAVGLLDPKDLPTLDAVLRRFRDAPEDDVVHRTLAAAASVGETAFFRHPSQLRALEHYLRYELLPHKRSQEARTVRAWSAGCSTGEEVYTLTLLLRQAMPELRIEVLGTDMNERALGQAREGCYGARSLRAVPPELFPQNFAPTSKGYEVNPALREGVSFLRHNLVKDECPAPSKGLQGFDVVLCRNVLIYLDHDEIPPLIRRLCACVNPKGVLVLSQAEYAWGQRAAGFVLREGGFFVRDG
jgi:chemotaxis protein methyltransferase CheR